MWMETLHLVTVCKTVADKSNQVFSTTLTAGTWSTSQLFSMQTNSFPRRKSHIPYRQVWWIPLLFFFSSKTTWAVCSLHFQSIDGAFPWSTKFSKMCLEMYFAEKSEKPSLVYFLLGYDWHKGTDTGLYCLPHQEGASPFSHSETGHWCGFLFSLNKNCGEDNHNY